MTKAADQVIKQYEQYVMHTYVRSPLVLTKGKGARVWDIGGRQYLDFFPGWGVSGLGHNHPWVAGAIRGQVGRLMHVSNNYYHPLQAKAAKQLVEAAFDGKAFFCNSGAEAVETALKLAKRHGNATGGRHEIIVMDQSFHGRTLGALSATGQTKHQEGFEPMLPGFVRVPYNNLGAAQDAITAKTCAILVEPIQGEGGIHVATTDYLVGLRRLCDAHKLLLIVDEIQTGMGRTGTLFAYQRSGVTPDVLVLAKTLGGGFPVGAVIARREIADTLTPGSHGTTYGGNPVACAAILAVLEAIKKQQLAAKAEKFGKTLFARLAKWKARYRFIHEVRGRGLMAGIELSVDGRPLVDACRQKGLLINCTQGKVLRLLPPMTITSVELSTGLAILEQVFDQAVGAGAGARSRA